MLRFLGLLLLLGSRTAYALTGSPAPSGAMTAIVAADSEWLDAMRQHDTARIVAPYDSDGVFVSVDGTTIRGRDRIAALYRTRFPKIVRVVCGGIVQEGTRALNDSLVIEWGHGGMTYTDSTAAEHASYGPYLTVWRRSRTGKWLIIRNLVF